MPLSQIAVSLIAAGCFNLMVKCAQAADAGSSKPGGAITNVVHVDAIKASTLITNRDVVVLDVRTPEEFKEGHIAGATNINFQSADFEKRIGALDKGKTYLVHCAVGGRSTRCLPILQRQQIKTIIHLDGGITAWEKAGLPVEK